MNSNQTQFRNPDWLEANLDEAREQIKSKLAQNHLVHEAIGNLLDAMPYISSRPELLLWQPVLINAMSHAQGHNDLDSQIQLWSYLGICMLRDGKHKSASQAFEQGLKKIDAYVTPTIELTARIGILHGQSIFHTYDIGEFITETIQLARRVQDISLLARLHFTLGIVYTHRKHTRLALGHAQTALGYWWTLDHVAEKDRALLLMSEACRVAKRYEISKYFLSHSLSRYTSLFQSAIAHYQDGTFAHLHDNFDDAQASLETALAEFQAVGDYPYMIGAVHHALGLTYTKQDNFVEARRSLRVAMAIWLRLENVYQEANALYGIGFLEQRQYQYQKADEYYQHALDRLATLPPSPMIEDLQQKINENREELTQ